MQLSCLKPSPGVAAIPNIFLSAQAFCPEYEKHYDTPAVLRRWSFRLARLGELPAPNVMPTTKHSSWQWSTIEEAWRWRGPAVFFLLGLREICRPLVYWHVFHIFQMDLTRQPVPEPYASEKIDIKICPGEVDPCRAKEEILAMGQLQPAEVDLRFERGDKAAIAYIGGKPVGYAWMSSASGVVELAFDVTWIAGPGESIRYDYFVLPEWRGRRINSCLNAALLAFARDHGINRTFASVSAFNRQSLSLAKHQQRTPAMKVTLVHVRGLNHTFQKAVGGPFESRFSKRG
jgi:GNAT superfamily N-acetyltransferase